MALTELGWLLAWGIPLIALWRIGSHIRDFHETYKKNIEERGRRV